MILSFGLLGLVLSAEPVSAVPFLGGPNDFEATSKAISFAKDEFSKQASALAVRGEERYGKIFDRQAYDKLVSEINEHIEDSESDLKAVSDLANSDGDEEEGGAEGSAGSLAEANKKFCEHKEIESIRIKMKNDFSQKNLDKKFYQAKVSELGKPTPSRGNVMVKYYPSSNLDYDITDLTGLSMPFASESEVPLIRLSFWVDRLCKKVSRQVKDHGGN